MKTKRPWSALALVLAALTAGPVDATPRARQTSALTIMIDPGHGGTNLGAAAADGTTHEKRLTLLIAHAMIEPLEELLPQARVLLTRKDDVYLTLDQRVRLANAAKADLFVSLHLNASPNRQQRGYEVYFLDSAAAHREAERLAQRPSASKPEAQGAEPAELATSAAASADLTAIVSDLQQRAAHVQSLALARALHRALRQALPKAHDRGIKQAAYDVLLGLRMPGVLVEAGFIDHAEEGRALGQPPVQRRIARALAHGIAAYARQLAASAR